MSVQRADQLGHRVGVTFAVGGDTVVQRMPPAEIHPFRWYRYIDAEEDRDGQRGVERVGFLDRVDGDGRYCFTNGRADSAADVREETAAPALDPAAGEEAFDAGGAAAENAKTDPERIASLVADAKSKAATQAHEWLTLLATESGQGISEDDANAARPVLRKLYAVSLVAEGFSMSFATYAAAVHHPFEEALDILAPLLAEEISSTLRIDVSTLEGSNHSVLTNPSHIQEQMSYPYRVFETAFGMLDIPDRLALMARYRVFEQNIEKYGTIATSFIERRMLADSDPVDRLVAELSGSVTASGGGGVNLWFSVLNHLKQQFEDQQDEPSGDDMDDEFDFGSSADFNAWLADQGYTVEVIHAAINRAAGGNYALPLEEFRTMWERNVRHEFLEYSEDDDGPSAWTGS